MDSSTRGPGPRPNPGAEEEPRLPAPREARVDTGSGRYPAESPPEPSGGSEATVLADVSHELRTPLSGILGMSEVLLETDLSPLQRECAETIERSAAGLLAVVDDILDFAKITGGKPRIERIPFDLRAIAEEVVRLLAPQARAKGIDLHLRHPPDVPRHLVGDPTRIRQILVNLVGNGIKFTPAGHVLVAIDGVANAEQGARITIVVEDTGIGFSKEEETRIFEPFGQANVAIAHRFSGTGLGLPISRRLAERMGGSLQARSEPGHGSVFTLRLDLAVDPRPVDRAPPSPSVAGKRVLCVGGSRLGRAILLEELEALGMHARGAHDARHAHSLLGLALPPFDVVLVEPGQHEDPVAVHTLLHRGAGARATPVVRVAPLSASEPAGEVALLRPVRQAQLVAALESALGLEVTPGRRPGGAGSRPGVAEPPESLGRPRILVAEDDPVHQKVAVGCLERLGCAVEVAPDGTEALDRFAARTFDLVLVDCQMPVMNGYETAERMRALKGIGERTPIVAVTAHTDPSDRARCLASGMDDYLAKPLRIDALRAMVTRWLGEPRGNLSDPSGRRAAASGASLVAASGSDSRSEPGLDTDKLAELREVVGDTGLAEVVDVFLTDTQTLLEGLREAAAGRDPVRVRALAHRLKSSSASVGARRLSRLMRAIEGGIGADATDHAWDELAQLLDEATDSFVAVRAHLAEPERAA